jgi:biopolymer transport protein ExbB
MDALLQQFEQLWNQATAIWFSGGWAMLAIAVVALVVFGLGMHIFLSLRAKGFESVPEKTWRRWLEHPAERKGPIGRLISIASDTRTLEDATVAFRELRSSELAPFDRDLRVMKICVGAAPLLGLLGTVTGMLATFGALASGSGGEQTMALVATGISEALITTETGLVIALPSLFFQYLLARKQERFKVFLTHLETVCTQRLYQRLRASTQTT